MPIQSLQTDTTSPTYEFEDVEKHMELSNGKDAMVALWEHGKSVSSAYWDPRGRSIVSTSYDDKLRSESVC